MDKQEALEYSRGMIMAINGIGLLDEAIMSRIELPILYES